MHSKSDFGVDSCQLDGAYAMVSASPTDRSKTCMGNILRLGIMLLFCRLRKLIDRNMQPTGGIVDYQRWTVE